jgi:hypothetical protein
VISSAAEPSFGYISSSHAKGVTRQFLFRISGNTTPVILMKIITRMRTGGHRMGKSKKKYTEATAMHAVPFHVKATKI